MLVAAAELIAERGFSETRIADVAQARRRVARVGHLLLRHQGQPADRGAALLRGASSTSQCTRCSRPPRRSATGSRMLVRLTCVPMGTTRSRARGGCGSTCGRRHSDTRRWPRTGWSSSSAGGPRSRVSSRTGSRPERSSRSMPRTSRSPGRSLLDGLSIQVALRDPIVDPERAFDIAMTFAEQALALPTRSPTARRTTTRSASNGKAARRA